jgi:hypothetical protein
MRTSSKERRLFLLLIACVCSLTGCDVESNFVLEPTVLPAGLQNDPRLKDVDVSRIEIFFYTHDPVTIYVFDSSGEEVLAVQGTYRDDPQNPRRFFITVNGIESGYERTAGGVLTLLPENP